MCSFWRKCFWRRKRKSLHKARVLIGSMFVLFCWWQLFSLKISSFWNFYRLLKGIQSSLKLVFLYCPRTIIQNNGSEKLSQKKTAMNSFKEYQHLDQKYKSEIFSMVIHVKFSRRIQECLIEKKAIILNRS